MEIKETNEIKHETEPKEANMQNTHTHTHAFIQMRRGSIAEKQKQKRMAEIQKRAIAC